GTPCAAAKHLIPSTTRSPPPSGPQRRTISHASRKWSRCRNSAAPSRPPTNAARNSSSVTQLTLLTLVDEASASGRRTDTSSSPRGCPRARQVGRASLTLGFALQAVGYVLSAHGAAPLSHSFWAYLALVGFAVA